jgi:hypothetical protein
MRLLLLGYLLHRRPGRLLPNLGHFGRAHWQRAQVRRSLRHLY